MDRVTEITESVFNALAQLQRRDSAVGSPELIHQQFCTYIDQCARLGTKLGLVQQDVDEIRYALVALVDETVLSRTDALREFWMPRVLQLKYFGENVAGEMFFERLAALRRDPTRAPALKVYYLCLLFGFRGKYRVRGGELELLDIQDSLRNELIRSKLIPNEVALSPSGARPYEPSADRRRNWLLVALAIAAAASSMLLYVWLRLSLVDRAQQLVERLSTLNGA
jgi:type VI secretion system protein ImpK